MTSQDTLVSSLVQIEFQEKDQEKVKETRTSRVDKWNTSRRHSWNYSDSL